MGILENQSKRSNIQKTKVPEKRMEGNHPRIIPKKCPQQVSDQKGLTKWVNTDSHQDEYA